MKDTEAELQRGAGALIKPTRHVVTVFCSFRRRKKKTDGGIVSGPVVLARIPEKPNGLPPTTSSGVFKLTRSKKKASFAQTPIQRFPCCIPATRGRINVSMEVFTE